MKNFLDIIECWKVFKQYMNIEAKTSIFLQNRGKTKGLNNTNMQMQSGNITFVL
jgi:hypothetical protein